MKQALLFFALLVCFGTAVAQHRIQFIEADRSRQALISKTVSIDRVDGDRYTAYANDTELEALAALGYDYTFVEQPQAKAVSMASTLEEMAAWDRYPTYTLYVEMMQHFAEQYPSICQLDTIGTSVQGRLILCVKISDNVATDEAEPQFFYSSTMHGDEVTGYYFMLRLIDTLLNSYGSDSRLTQMINNSQIFINPLANPDGTYYSGNNTVQGAIRYNANYVDLNRNFPDPFGTEPLNAEQVENTAMRAYLAAHRFVLSANLHGGSEVMNYPWDSFTSNQRRHADRDWWTAVSKRYVDTCRNVSSRMYRDVTGSGYVAGGDWYVIPNGRQDYVNFYTRCRELTMEVSSTKTISSSELRPYWDAQGNSLINYIDEMHKGIHGRVTDSLTGEPLRAMIEVVGRDRDSSHVFSSLQWGDFYRMLPAGTYTLRITANGYRTKELSATVTDGAPLQLAVELSNGTNAIPTAEEARYIAYPNPAHDHVNIQTPQGTTTIDLSGYANGIHVITCHGKAFKVIKL